LGQITSDDFIQLLKKYGLILIGFELVTRFGISYLRNIYLGAFPIEDLSTLNDFGSAFSGLSILILDLIIALIILRELDKNKTLTWIIFGLTFLAPWISVIFLLLWKNVELGTKKTGIDN